MNTTAVLSEYQRCQAASVGLDGADGDAARVELVAYYGQWRPAGHD